LLELYFVEIFLLISEYHYQTLPDITASNSLGGSSSLVIDTNPPLILNLEIITPYVGKVFTAGDLIDLKMTFSTAVTILGQPILWLANTPLSIGSLRMLGFYLTIIL
jgi:hypothetical protein